MNEGDVNKFRLHKRVRKYIVYFQVFYLFMLEPIALFGAIAPADVESKLEFTSTSCQKKPRMRQKQENPSIVTSTYRVKNLNDEVVNAVGLHNSIGKRCAAN